MTAHEISKALEIWTLQTLLNISIILGVVALGMALVQAYYRNLRAYLSLRVSLEIWDLVTVLVVDLLLVFVVLVGFFVLNPDIMADIKVAVPFIPLATVLFALALVIRLFHGGHRPGHTAFRRALWLMAIANVINVIGFALVMEAPSGEYLELHPSPFWSFVKSHLRSNASPSGLELNQLCFYIFFPLLIGVFVYGFVRAMAQLNKPGGENA
jgi:hypothetical protein